MVSPEVAAYGEWPVDAGDTSTSTIAITVLNAGNADLHISGRALTGADANQFRIVLDTGRATLIPGARRTIAIVFNPASVGEKEAALEIMTDDPETPVAQVTLTGTGT